MSRAAMSGMHDLLDYFDRFQTGDTTLPSPGAQTELSRFLDAGMEHTLNELMTVLRQTNEHQARVATLHAQPRVAGKFAAKKVILHNASAFEQMIALKDWHAATQITSQHTFFFNGKGDIPIPIRVNLFGDAPPTMLHVFLGSTKGKWKGPVYEDWALQDPWQHPVQSQFIFPLEALEIVRQPQFSFATIFKGGAFEQEFIGPDWRYGEAYACVEKPNQKHDSKQKIKSAGLNVCELTRTLADSSDPTAEDIDISAPILYSSYTEAGYNDDLVAVVTPGAVIKASKRAIVDRNWDHLICLMETLAISKLGIPRTPMLCDFVARKLATNARL